ncbi:Signal peptidase complex subunit [Glugoides intestinalis]
MKSTYKRLFTFFSIVTNATVFLLFLITVLSYLFPAPPLSADLKVSWVSPNKHTVRVCQFQPSIDLSQQFNFNTKQIFLYLYAKSGDREEMVWSKIIKNGDNYKLFGIEKSTYLFSIAGKNFTEFELRGNIFPFVGLLRDVPYASFKYIEAQ